MPIDMKLLALDTSTELLHLGASDGERQLSHVRAGAAQASGSVLPLALETLTGLGLHLTELDAIVMGRGPGSFTGLRTACAVAQGLAFGADLPVLPIDTLLAVAEDARGPLEQVRVLTVLDARMGQFYAAAWEYRQGRWHEVRSPALLHPGEVSWPVEWQDPSWPMRLAGIGLEGLSIDAPTMVPADLQRVTAAPTAEALMRLAPAAWQAGQAVPADQAMPLYLRDKVALTSAERAAAAS
jgi:tRNA threonylcarbamoyladenosine biosynthesis protein TsaB